MKLHILERDYEGCNYIVIFSLYIMRSVYFKLVDNGNRKILYLRLFRINLRITKRSLVNLLTLK